MIEASESVVGEARGCRLAASMKSRLLGRKSQP